MEDYDSWIATTPHAARDLQERIVDILDDAGLTFDRVTVRVKDRKSYTKKLANPDYPDYNSFDSAYDLLGVRVITFHSSEIPQLKEALGEQFHVVTEIDKAAETARAGRFGYASQHLIVHDQHPATTPDAPHLIEIQLRTVLQHAWAEFEHDIRYKNPDGVSAEVERSFTLAAGLIELADQQFDKIAEIMDEQQRVLEEQHGFGPEHLIDAASLPRELGGIIGDSYPTSRVEYYSYAVDMLAAHGITTDAQLQQLLSPAKVEALCAAMDYSYRPGQVRLIDDALLFTYGRAHIKKTVHIGDNTHSRPGKLGSRWQQLGQRVYAET